MRFWGRMTFALVCTASQSVTSGGDADELIVTAERRARRLDELLAYFTRRIAGQQMYFKRYGIEPAAPAADGPS